MKTQKKQLATIIPFTLYKGQPRTNWMGVVNMNSTKIFTVNPTIKKIKKKG